jgi:hypothetical protein
VGNTPSSAGSTATGSSTSETEVLESEESTLEPHEYRFINRWRLAGDVESISEVIGDPGGYQRWWPCAWLDYEDVARGDQRGVGRVFRYKVKGWMPYTLNLTFHVRDVRTPNGYTVDATGDLVGQGIWTISQAGPRVEVTYEWRVRAERAFIRRLSGLLKPLFRSNHFWVMRNGARSLTLELARRRATTPEELARIPPPPGPTFPHNRRKRRSTSDTG